MNNKILSDYIIIGSGLAGLYGAYLASAYGTVSLLTKHSLQTSSTYWAQGGIASAIDENDSPGIHFEDTIKTGRGLCNPDAVKILVNEGPIRINELIAGGLAFDMSGNEYSLGLEGGHTRRRILHLGGNETGRVIVEFLIDKIKKSEKIKVYENFLVHNLIMNDNECGGCCAYSREVKTDYSFHSKVVLLASGGAAGIYKGSTNPQSSTGDGITLAYNAGLEIVNMEFIQFHPTAFFSDSGKTFLLTEALRGEGAYLINKGGKRFMEDYHKLAELAPRDKVSESIYREAEKEKTDHLYLSLKHLNKYFIKSRFKNIYEKALEFNIDITSDNIPIAPAAHYTVGGIRTDLKGETTINRIYATGEISHTGVHGANRLASNSLLECIVFSFRAIEDSIKYLNEDLLIEQPTEKYYVNDKMDSLYLKSKKKILNTMTRDVGIVRYRDSICNAVDIINNIQDEWNFQKNEYYSDRLNNLITTARLIINGALVREETRGGHIRDDFPFESAESYYTVQSLDGGIKKVNLSEVEAEHKK